MECSHDEEGNSTRQGHVLPVAGEQPLGLVSLAGTYRAEAQVKRSWVKFLLYLLYDYKKTPV